MLLVSFVEKTILSSTELCWHHPSIVYLLNRFARAFSDHFQDFSYFLFWHFWNLISYTKQLSYQVNKLRNILLLYPLMGIPWWLSSKESTCSAGDAGSIAGSGRSLEKGMATHCSILAWEVPWTEEPGGLQSMSSQRIGYNWAHTHSYPL